MKNLLAKILIALIILLFIGLYIYDYVNSKEVVWTACKYGSKCYEEGREPKQCNKDKIVRFYSLEECLIYVGN